MDKNIIYAFVASSFIIMVFYLVFPPQRPAPSAKNANQKEKTTQSNPLASENKQIIPKTANQLVEQKKESKIIKIDSELYHAELDTAGGGIKSFILKNYTFQSKPRFDLIKYLWNGILGRGTSEQVYDPNKKVNLVYTKHLSQNQLPWTFFLNSQQPLFYEANKSNLNVDKKDKIVLQAVTPAGATVIKALSFNPDNYLVTVDLTVFNPTEEILQINPSFIIGPGGEPNETDYQARPGRAIIYQNNDLDIYDGGDLDKYNSFSNFAWIGIMDIYFIQSIKGLANWEAKLLPEKLLFKGSDTTVPFLELKSEKESLIPGENWQTSFEIFIGPKEKDQMALFSRNLEQSLDLTFDFLGQPMLIALRWFYDFIPNWGVAIIFLTILVRLLIFPLTYKGMKSMRKLSLLGPKIQALKKKFGNNKEKFNKEMLQVYKKHKVNPMGGCLPLLLQIPIFIALYSALIPAIELRHSSFIFWINDLSQSDFLYVLPVLMGISMYLQQKMTPVSASMDPTQQKIMKWLPVLMTFFFLSFPSSLVLYWLTSNIISIALQQLMNKTAAREKLELESVK